MSALETMVGHLDLATMRGLEIGPLHNPWFTRDRADIRYLDHATSDELRVKYATNPDTGPRSADMVTVDYVWTPGARLADIVRQDAPFDFVVASHVFEHLPNPLGWLSQVSEILTDCGLLLLVIPDKRYCFDVRRPVTSPAQIIDAYRRNLQRPSFAQAFDHHWGFLGNVSAEDLWEGRCDIEFAQRTDVPDPAVYAYQRCVEFEQSKKYDDVHCSVFTPHSFLRVLDVAARIDLLDFEVLDFFPTAKHSFEFYATLRRTTGERPATKRTQIASIEGATSTVADHDNGSCETATVELSRPEMKLIAWKRALIWRARRVLATLKRS